MANLSVRQQLVAHRARLKRLRWISGGAGAMVAASMLLPPLLLQFTPSSGLRTAVALASGVLAIVAVIAARATQSRLDDFQWALTNLAEHARDLKARAANDATARAEYIACLHEARAELRSMSQRLRVRGDVSADKLVAVLESIDAEILLNEKALAPNALASIEAERRS